ncbi:MAG: hypothetical protein ACRC9U_02215 [Metamycoplasmataceae bacterium]
MNKKLIISLSSLSIIVIVAPVLAVTSCIGNTSVNVNDLVITPKTVPKLTQEDVTTLKGTEHSAQLIVLNKLFGGTGLSSANQENFRVLVDENNKMVTLMANTGFTINGKPLLESSKYKILSTDEITDLTIIATKDAKLTETEVAALDAPDATAKWSSLQKLFAGADFKAENLDSKFTIAVDTKNKKVTLTAKSGFTISSQQTLTNIFTVDNNPVVPTDLTIIATKDAKLTEAEAAALDAPDATAKWKVLEKLFAGADFKVENLDSKFTITVDTKNKKVTLTAKSGFTISSQQTLSNTFIVDNAITPSDLTITAKGTVTLNGDQIINLTSTTAATQLTALKLLFEGEGLTEANLANFDVTVNSSTNIVTLTAKPNFTINTKPTLDSGKYTVRTIALDSYPLKSIQLTSQEIDDLNDPIKAKPILSRMFSDLNFSRFTWTVNKTRRIVTLTAKQGFIFKNGGGPTLSSNPWINV